MSPDRPRRFPVAKIAAAVLGAGIAVGLTAEAPVREASPTTAAERVVAAGTRRLGPTDDSMRPRSVSETASPGTRAGAVPRSDDATSGTDDSGTTGGHNADDRAHRRRGHGSVTSFARRQWRRLRTLDR